MKQLLQLIMIPLFLFVGYSCKGHEIEEQRLDTKELTLKVGETKEIKVTPTSGELRWTSLVPAIASVSSTGGVTANKVGETKIEVEDLESGFKGVCEVTAEGNFNTFKPVVTEWGITMDELKAKESRVFDKLSEQSGQDYLVYKGENAFVGGDVYYAFDKKDHLLIRVELYASFTSDENAEKDWQEMLNFWGERYIEISQTADEVYYESIDGKTTIQADKSLWDFMEEIPVVYMPIEE